MMQTKISELRELKHVIESLRLEMINTGISKGFCHKRTIELSQKLDENIFKYQLFRYKKESL